MSEADRTAMLLDLASPAVTGRRPARAQNFSVEQVVGLPAQPVGFASELEMILLLPDGGGTIESANGTTIITERAVVIVPPGAHRFRFAGHHRLFVCATGRTDIGWDACQNAEGYQTADPRVAPIAEPFRRIVGVGQIHVLPIAAIPHPPTNPRLKFVQSATMSINWVEYDAPRDRTALSPHKHEDLEQGSLAIEGHFVHHLRTPWGTNADLWREDMHMEAGPSSLLIIPPEVIHTTEGVGDSHHVLVDIFAPPRRDFIAKDWIFNASDYRDPQAA